MDIRHRIELLIGEKYGRVEEQLMASGLIDSLRTVELALALEQEFGLPPDTFALSDMRTIGSLLKRVLSASRVATP